jgi:hypothetical protein
LDRGGRQIVFCDDFDPMKAKSINQIFVLSIPVFCVGDAINDRIRWGERLQHHAAAFGMPPKSLRVRFRYNAGVAPCARRPCVDFRPENFTSAV